MTLLLDWRGRAPLRVLGLMTGTSGDGLDAALVRFPRRGRPILLDHRHHPFPAPVRARLQALMKMDRLEDFARAGPFVAGLYRDAVRAMLPDLPVRPDLLAAHGQTVAHHPAPGADPVLTPAATLQVFEPAVLAQGTGLPVASGFRPADVAVGGQGAPLVPIGDLAFFGCLPGDSVVLNLGGIANVTVIRRSRGGHRPRWATAPGGCQDGGETRQFRAGQRGGPARVVQAFDTGPANMLMDEAMRRLTGGREDCDRDGRLAAAGSVDHRRLQEWLTDDPFLALPPPRSTGREDYGPVRFDRMVGALSDWRPADLLATLAAFTVATVADAITRFVLPAGPLDRCLVAGGGAFNPVIMAGLGARLAPTTVAPTSVAGMPVAAREAAAFAVLGAHLVLGRPGNVPVATGAMRPVRLGSLTLP